MTGNPTSGVPQPLPVNPEGIPEALKRLDQWVAWNYGVRDGKPTKVPYQINGNKASTTNPTTWSTFSAGWEAYQRGDFAGTGFVFVKDGGLVGIDLDHCIDAQGTLKPWAQAIVERFPHAYWERSPSGTGLHAILAGTIPTNKTGERIKLADGGIIEVYQHGRYFCVTGHRFGDGAVDLGRTTHELDVWFSETFRKPKPAKKPATSSRVSTTRPSDAHIIELATTAKNGDKFQKLWSGDTSDHPSHSEADLALCGLLAFYVGPDESRIDALFRQSGLVTDKWEQREDYRQSTIAKALEGRTEFYAARSGQETNSPSTTEMCPYRASQRGLIYYKPTRDAVVPVTLTNFTAEIIADVALDDGAEVRRLFELRVQLNGSTFTFDVPAAQYSSLNWVTEKLGATALVHPGSAIKDLTRAAIQMLSPHIENRTIYAHYGWRQFGNDWIYLHSGGAIGPNGPVPGVEVQVASLEGYSLPEEGTNEELVGAIRKTFQMLDVAPRRIMYPILAAVWRSVIAKADFSIFLVGPTGTAKSEISALAQQHFGPGMNARHLPANWSSTGNSLEATAFASKDTLLVIDDFAPQGSPADVARYHRDADRVFRAQGNSAGRGRMRSDTTLRPARNPRGLIFSTGEDVPKGHSVRARCLVLEISPNDTDWKALSTCQRDAAAGVYAQVMAGYVRWLAVRYDEIIARHKSRIVELRETACRTAAHRRTPSMVAELVFAGETFFQFCVDVGALSPQDAIARTKELWQAVGEAASAQHQHQAAVDPVNRFVELLSSAVASGDCHLAHPDGGEPRQPEAFGWRFRKLGSGDNTRGEWHPCGTRVGWVDEQGVYLDSEAAYRAAQRMASGDPLPVTTKTLQQRLKERGFLVRHEPNRCTVRMDIENRRQRVLHLRPNVLSADSGPSGPNGPDAPDSSVFWTDAGTDQRRGPSAAVPAAVQKPLEKEGSGPLGPLGPQNTPETGSPVLNDEQWFEFAHRVVDEATQRGEEDEWTF